MASPPTQSAGLRTVLVVGAVWAVASAVVGRRPPGRVVVHAAGVVALVVLLAPNVGRALGLAAGLSVVGADLVLSSLLPRSRSATALAGAVLTAAQLALVQRGIGGLLAIEALACAVVIGDRALPSLGRRGDAALVRAGRAAPGRVARAGRTVRSGAADGTVAVRGRLRRASRVAGAAVGHARRRWPALLVGAVWAAASVPVTRHAIAVAGDYAVHLEYARRSHLLPPWSPAPHPAFHLSVALLRPLFGLSGATVAVMAVGAAATAWALLWVASRPLASGPALGRVAAMAYALGYLVVETPATLVVWLGLGSPAAGGPALHDFTNPTDTLAVPFAVVLTVAVAQWLDAVTVSRRHDVAVSAFAVLSMTVKPSTGLVLIVAVPLHLLATRAGRERWQRAALWFGAPLVAVTAVQTWWVEHRLIDARSSSIVIQPGRTVEALGLEQAGPLLLTVLLVVPLALWAGRRRYLAEPVVGLSLWAAVVGVAMLLVLAEDGSRAADGTFAKPGLMATIVLCLVSWRFLFGEAAGAVADLRRGDRPRAWLLAGAVLAAVSLAAGVLAYLDAAGALDAGFRSPA